MLYYSERWIYLYYTVILNMVSLFSLIIGVIYFDSAVKNYSGHLLV